MNGHKIGDSEESFIPISKSDKFEELLSLRETATKEAIDSLILKKTPEDAVFSRQGRGNKSFSYVQAWWLIDQLNALFDYDWDWEIFDQEIRKEHVW